MAKPSFKFWFLTVALVIVSVEVGLSVLAPILAKAKESGRRGFYVPGPMTSAIDPYLLWRPAPTSSPGVNVDEQGVRKSWNPVFSPGQKHRTVYAFGGSTMWGAGAADEETIPSHLSRALNERDGAYEVVNYGVGGYVLTQEMLKLVLLLRQGLRPDVVVFYDGANDVDIAYQAGKTGSVYGFEETRAKLMQRVGMAAVKEEPSVLLWKELFSRLKVVEILQRALFRQRPQRQFPNRAKDFDGQELKALTDNIAGEYILSYKMLQDLSRAYGFKFYMFWQPVSFTETVLDHGQKPKNDWEETNLIKMHDLARARMKDLALANYAYIGDVLLGHSVPVYMDYCHLNSEGNRMVAQAMFKHLKQAGDL